MKKLTYFTLFLLCLSGEIFSQTTTFKKNEYPLGKIMLSDFKKIDVSNVIIGKDSAYYYNTSTGKNQTNSFSDINYFRVPEGNHVNAGVGIGALTSVVIVLTAVSKVSSNPNLQFKDNAIETSMIFIAAGAGLGGLLGAITPRWKTYYFGNQKTGSLRLLPKLNISPNSFGLGINCSISSAKVVK